MAPSLALVTSKPGKRLARLPAQWGFNFDRNPKVLVRSIVIPLRYLAAGDRVYGLFRDSPVTQTYEGLNGHIEAPFDRTRGLSLSVAIFSWPHTLRLD